MQGLTVQRGLSVLVLHFDRQLARWPGQELVDAGHVPLRNTQEAGPCKACKTSAHYLSSGSHIFVLVLAKKAYIGSYLFNCQV